MLIKYLAELSSVIRISFKAIKLLYLSLAKLKSFSASVYLSNQSLYVLCLYASSVKSTLLILSCCNLIVPFNLAIQTFSYFSNFLNLKSFSALSLANFSKFKNVWLLSNTNVFGYAILFSFFLLSYN